jgi:Flp pilus assembly CpaE family ATPase
MASLRAAVSALHIYERLGFTQDKFKIILNTNIQNSGLRQAQLEKALGYPIDYVLPYESTAVVRAVNLGEPFVLTSPGLAISSKLEDLAYVLSSDIHKNIPPAVPSPTWKRVTSRVSHPGGEATSP